MLAYLDVGSGLKRLLSIVKQRGSFHDHNVRELKIGRGGVELALDASSVNEILAVAYGAGRAHARRPRGT